jgi:hypothetical protein
MSQPYRSQPYMSQPYSSQPYRSQPYSSQLYRRPPYRSQPYRPWLQQLLLATASRHGVERSSFTQNEPSHRKEAF